jgi:beta-lactamase regulating signal transducer with metallopeptidase domain
MEMLATFAFKSFLIAGAALGLLHLFRSRSAAERSVIAHLGLLALVLFPLGSIFLPQLVVSLPLTEPPSMTPAPLVSEPLAATASQPTADLSGLASAPTAWWPLLYGIPATLLLIVTLLAVLRLLALRARASVLVEPSWLSALAHAQRRMDFKHGTALLTSSELNSPISWGVLRPVILLNEEALKAHGKAQAIIAHELAHVRGLDWAKLLLGRIATAVFWFNPLVWLLAREAHQLREETADDAVLAANVASTDYAQLLVGVARHDCKGMLLGAHGVAPGKHSLTRRVRRVLDGTLPRTPIGKGFAGGLFFGAVVTATPLAAITFLPRSAEGLSPALSVAAPSPSDSLPSVVARSLADATAVTTERVGLAIAGTAASEASSDAVERGRSVEAKEQAFRASGQAMTSLAMAHPHPSPHPLPEPQVPAPPFRRSASDIAADRAITAKALGITPDYAAGIRAAAPGVRIDDDDLVGLRAVGVTPDWLRAMTQAGYGSNDVGDLTGARAVGVSPTYVAELASAGLRNVSLDHLTAMRALGITGRSIRHLRAGGYRDLTPDRLIELQAYGMQAFATGRRGPPPNWPPEAPRRDRGEVPEPPEPPEPDQGG